MVPERPGSSRPGPELNPEFQLDQALADYWSGRWRRNNARRLEFLAALRLPIEGRRVLELGAGIGDHTEFFLDRGCEVTAIEGRSASVQVMQARFAAVPGVRIQEIDLDPPPDDVPDVHEVVACLGLLYHLRHPQALLDWAARRAGTLLVLETIVDPGRGQHAPVLRDEDASRPGSSIHGTASRVTRDWVWQVLAGHFPHVYTTARQVPHYEFPLDWDACGPGATRALFVASHVALRDSWLVTTLPSRHPWP